MPVAKIALRNITRQKKRNLLLGGAIAFGMLIICSINAIATGFLTNLEENFSFFLSGHILIGGNEKSPAGRSIGVIRDDSEIIDCLEKGDYPIRQIVKRSGFSGTLIFEGKKIMQEIVGVDWQTEQTMLDRLSFLAKEADYKTNPRSIFLSKRMSEKLKVELGDTLLVQLRTVTGQQNIGEFVLSGIFNDPGLFGSLSAYADRAHVNKLLNIEAGEYTDLGIMLEKISQMDKTADSIYSRLKEQGTSLFSRLDLTDREARKSRSKEFEETWQGTRYWLITLNDFLKQVKQFIGIFNIIAWILLMIVLGIIIIGIVNTYRMVVYERIREIGTMRALGMQKKTLLWTFVLEVLLLTTGSGLIGIALSYLVTGGISLLELVPPHNFFYLATRQGHLVFNILPQHLAVNMFLIVLFSFIAALFPALKAARMKPVNALHNIF